MKLFVLFSALLATSTALHGQWVRWPVSNGGNGHWYAVVRTPGLIDWATARTNVQSQGGYFATITSAQENAFVFNLAKNPNNWNGELGPLLGGYQPPPGAPEPDGGWTWLNGDPWGYTNWRAGQPDNANPNESALHFWGGTGGGPAPTWNDYPTNIALFVSYVIERETPPPLTVHIRFSQVGISWDSISNAHYQVEYRSEITTNVWVPLTTNTIVGTGEQIEVRDDLPPGIPRRLYRVAENP